MEFLNFVLILITAYMALCKPQKERLVSRALVVVSVPLMVVLFSIVTRTALLPRIKY